MTTIKSLGAGLSRIRAAVRSVVELKQPEAPPPPPTPPDTFQGGGTRTEPRSLRFPPPGSGVSPSTWRRLSIEERRAMWQEAQQRPAPEGWPTGPLGPSQVYSEDAALMQARLVELGFMEDPGDAAGLYGGLTTEGVRRFQLANGIVPATGTADVATLAAMGAGTPRSRQDVEALQRDLVRLGYLPSPGAGRYGEYDQATEQAMLAFQLANGLAPNGAATGATLDALASPRAVPLATAMASLDGVPIGQAAGVAAEGPVPDAANLGSTVQVGASDINCRQTRSTSALVEGQFPAGAQLTVTGPLQDGWYPVSGQGTNGETLTGWVSATVVSPPSTPAVDARLQALGYLEPTGTTDPEAIRNFQLMNGLPETGALDQPTLDRMWSADAARSSHIVQFLDDRYNPLKNLSTGGSTTGDNSCGPSSVAMALEALGLATMDNADPQALVNQIRADTGTLQGDTTGPGELEAAARLHGASTYHVGSMELMVLALGQGDPVVLYGVPNRGGTYYNAPASEGGIHDGAGHWVTVLGYDPATRTFLVNDPLCRDGTLRLTWEQLETYADFSVDSVAVARP